MKQELPLQNGQSEQALIGYENISERMLNLPNGEIDSQEVGEANRHAGQNVVAAQELILTTSLPNPVMGDNKVVVATTVNNNPSVAGDEDLIEMEWVKKAKKIIYETQDNPHLREEEVNKLQIDYVEKRYGRKLGGAK